MITRVKQINYIILQLFLINWSCYQDENVAQKLSENQEYSITDFIKTYCPKFTKYKFLILVNAQHCQRCQTDEVNFIFNKLAPVYSEICIVLFDYEKHPFNIETSNIKANILYFSTDTAYKYNIMYPESKFFIIKEGTDIIENFSIHTENHDTIIKLIDKYLK